MSCKYCGTNIEYRFNSPDDDHCINATCAQHAKKDTRIADLEKENRELREQLKQTQLTLSATTVTPEQAEVIELREQLRQAEWRDASELTYDDDTTYLVRVYWIEARASTTEMMYYSSVHEQWRYESDSSSPGMPLTVTHFRELPSPPDNT